MGAFRAAEMLLVQANHLERDVHYELDVLLDFNRLRFGRHVATFRLLGYFALKSRSYRRERHNHCSACAPGQDSPSMLLLSAECGHRCRASRDARKGRR